MILFRKTNKQVHIKSHKKATVLCRSDNFDATVSFLRWTLETHVAISSPVHSTSACHSSSLEGINVGNTNLVECMIILLND